MYPFHVAPTQRHHQTADPAAGFLLRLQISSRKHRQETVLHFVIRKVEQEGVEISIVSLDGQVSALIDHRQRALHVGFVVDEFLRGIILARQLVHVLLKMRKQTDQVGWCACAEPVVIQTLTVQCVQQTERIVNVRHPFTEVIPVVLLFQTPTHLFRRTLVFSSHGRNRFRKCAVNLFLRDAAKRLVTRVHADVLRLVETAEYAHLRELRHPRQQHKLQMAVRTLKHRVERLQHITVPFFQACVYIQNVQNRLVVLIHEHHGTATGLTVRRFQNIPKPKTDIQCLIGLYGIFLLPFPDIILKHHFQNSLLREIRPVKIHMKHRMHRPFRFQTLHGQATEQLLAAQIIVLQRRDQQTLAETTRTAQKVNAAFVRQTENQIGLVHINITVLYNALKTLDAYRIFHNFPLLWLILSLFIFLYPQKRSFLFKEARFIPGSAHSATAQSPIVPVSDEKLAPIL
jgi:hypothetical protein